MIEMSADGGLDTKGKPKPLKRRALSRAARHLLDEKPGLLQHPVMLPLLRLMLQKLVIVDPLGAPSPKAVGLAVTMGTLGPNAVSDEQARACMVELTGKTPGAVKQAHNEVKKLRGSVCGTGIYLDGVPPGPRARPKADPLPVEQEPEIGLEADPSPAQEPEIGLETDPSLAQEPEISPEADPSPAQEPDVCP